MKFAIKPALIIALLWWLFAQFMGWIAGVYAGCGGGWTEVCWSRWDSALYLEIARQGHTLFPCPDWPGNWCGNAGWAPLYPLLMFVFGKVGISHAVAGIIISQFFYLALLVLSAKMAGIRDYGASGILAVGMAAFAPGSIYFQAIFPSSMAVFFMSLTVYCALKEQNYLAGIAAFFAVLSYSIGFLLIGALGLWLLFEWKYSKQFKFKSALSILLPGITGLGLWFLYDHLSTGHWNALFMVQSKYGHGLNSPLKMLGLHWDKMINSGLTLEVWVEIQTLLVTSLLVLTILFAWKNRQNSASRLQAIWICVFWLFPFSASMHVSLHRSCSNLLPGWLLFSGTRIRAALLVLFFILWWPLAVLFFQSRII
jgi:hypothetical protein